MNIHIRVDETLGLIHSISITSANVNYITQADKLLHGKESCVWGDAGYAGIEKRDKHKEISVDWLIAMHPGKIVQLTELDPIRKVEKVG
jgi:IS5 family transposase